MSERKNPIVVAVVGRPLTAKLRETMAGLDWHIIQGPAPVAALRVIRRARAKVAVIEIVAGPNTGLELIRLLSGPVRESVVVAVCGSHDEAVERTARALGAACYVPFTRDVTPIISAVSGILNSRSPAEAERVHARAIRPIQQISSFPSHSKLFTSGGRASPPPARWKRMGHRTMQSD
jgi:DNA-binding NarL/FixJ family response regulator